MRRAIAGLAALGVGASLVVAAGLPVGAAPHPGPRRRSGEVDDTCGDAILRTTAWDAG